MMILNLKPDYLLELGLEGDDETDTDEVNTLYIRMKPFFIGAKGEPGDKGDTNNENIFSHVDW